MAGALIPRLTLEESWSFTFPVGSCFGTTLAIRLFITIPGHFLLPAVSRLLLQARSKTTSNSRPQLHFGSDGLIG